MNDITPELRKLIYKMRDEGQGSPLAILKAAKSQGIPINFAQVGSLVRREGMKSGIFMCPDFIPEFIISYLKDSAPKTILDCWAGLGTMLVPLVQKFEPTMAIAFNQSGSEHEAANLLHPDKAIDWRLGEPFQLLDDLNTRFDVIVGCPPLGEKLRSTLILENNSVEVRDSLGKLMILKASQLLESGGIGFFVTSPNFMWMRDERQVFANLGRLGLFVDAALSIPSRFTRLPIDELLLIIRREKPLKLFVGELSSDQTSDVLLRNLKARKEGKTPQLGALVESEAFSSFSQLVTEYEVQSLARPLGISPTRLSEICTEINFIKKTEQEEFIELPNAVYLPIIDSSPAVASLAELQHQAKNYAQIVLKPELAIAEYLANFFNTNLGKKILESIASTLVIPRISKSDLNDVIIYLPDIEIQAEIISIQSAITDLNTQLNTLQRQLWNQPKKYKEIQKKVDSLKRNDDLPQWIESLPFPLSSILWKYHAVNNEEYKVKYLFFFFEALSEFTAILMLSAYAAEPVFYMQSSEAWRGRILETDTQNNKDCWILHASFGDWQKLGATLAKETRKLLQEKNTKESCLDLFRRPEKEFLEMLIDKRLFNILAQVNEERNLWKGHAGDVSPQEYHRCLILLESKLSEVRQLILDRWDTALLLLPGRSNYSQGINYYEVRALMGTRPPFREVEVETLEQMDANKLYLLHTNQKRPIELLPFIRLIEEPVTKLPACYFYSRVKSNKVRWVSYHFQPASEHWSSYDEMESAISLLYPIDDSMKESTP